MSSGISLVILSRRFDVLRRKLLHPPPERALGVPHSPTACCRDHPSVSTAREGVCMPHSPTACCRDLRRISALNSASGTVQRSTAHLHQRSTAHSGLHLTTDSRDRITRIRSDLHHISSRLNGICRFKQKALS